MDFDNLVDLVRASELIILLSCWMAFSDCECLCLQNLLLNYICFDVHYKLYVCLIGLLDMCGHMWMPYLLEKGLYSFQPKVDIDFGCVLFTLACLFSRTTIMNCYPHFSTLAPQSTLVSSISYTYIEPSIISS